MCDFRLSLSRCLGAMYWPWCMAEHVSRASAERKTKRSEPKTDLNGAVSGQNLPLKIRSTIKPLRVKISKSILKDRRTTKLSVNALLLCLCREYICLSGKETYHFSLMPRYGLGMLSV